MSEIPFVQNVAESAVLAGLLQMAQMFLGGTLLHF